MYLAFIAGLPSQQFVENASWSVLEEMSKRMVSRILVMNDDHNILELFRLILEPEGYEVHLAFIQLKHVSEVEKISPSLIILDLKFDHYAQGMLMLQQLRMYAPTMHIPILICTTALREMVDQEETLRHKGIPVLYKPFDIDELLQSVHQLLPPPVEREERSRQLIGTMFTKKYQEIGECQYATFLLSFSHDGGSVGYLSIFPLLSKTRFCQWFHLLRIPNRSFIVRRQR